MILSPKCILSAAMWDRDVSVSHEDARGEAQLTGPARNLSGRESEKIHFGRQCI